MGGVADKRTLSTRKGTISNSASVIEDENIITATIHSDTYMASPGDMKTGGESEIEG
jgi:hypothetical protein